MNTTTFPLPSRYQSADSRRLIALMWLEYAVEPENCRLATGLDATDAVWVAHQILQFAPGEGLNWAIDQDMRHHRAAHEEDYAKTAPRPVIHFKRKSQ